MKKQDLDDLASLYESVYLSTESGEYLVEGPYDAANVRAVQSFYATKPSPISNSPYQSRFACP